MSGCTVDGQPVPVALLAADPFRPLISLLREELGITGPKQGCAIGRCGACLVLLDGTPAQACLTPAFRLAGRAVTTEAGLDAALRARITTALEAERAIQCGACAPGLVVALSWILARGAASDAAEAELLLAGQICRCGAHDGVRRALALLLRQSGTAFA